MRIAAPWQVAKANLFRGRRVSPCFWCNLFLTRQAATLDHVVSVRRGGMDEGNTVLACRRCNDERALIQNLARDAAGLEEQGLAKVDSWFKRRETNLWLMLRWERLYHDRLSGEQLRECLAEIDEVLEV